MAEAPLVQRVADADATSFALDCLVMIGRRYGVDMTVDRLVKDNGLATPEVTPEQLLLCAERAGFRCRALTTKWSALADLRGALPAIVRFWDNRHAVLLRLEGEASAPRLVLQDPTAADGEPPLVMDRAAFEASWSGDLILIKRSLAVKEVPESFGTATIARMILADGALSRDLGVSTLALSLLGLLPIFFVQVMLTTVLDAPGVETFVFLCIGMALVVVFEGFFVALRRSLLGRLAIRLEHRLTCETFDRVLAMPIDYFETTPVGVTTHRMEQASAVAASLGGRAIATVLDAGLFILAIPVMFAYSLALTFLLAGIVAVIIVVTVILAPRIRERGRAVDAVGVEKGAFVSQSIAGFSTIKTVAVDGRLRQQWDVLTARATRLRLAESDATNLLQTFMTPLERLMVFGPFILGITLDILKIASIPLGVLFAFLLLAHRLAAPVRNAASLIREWDTIRRSIATLGDLMDRPVEDGRKGHGVRLPVRGQIEFINVGFEYAGALTPALNAVSFDVPLGTSLGIMGRTGAGKTTITRLLQRLHADYQGLIKIDGVDVREYDVGHLRSSVGVVLQDTFLFAGTIHENITAARPDASMDEIVHAARMAGAEDFIDRLPLGYETLLHEGAPDLSDGQRQRIAIARALIADPRILILDEATSALDPESEALVCANLKRLSHGRTLITISHRLSALANADSILVLDRGEVQDIGQHHELLERCDIYSGLWQRQHAPLEGPSDAAWLLPKGSNVA